MSSIVIIASIIALLAILVCYAFFAQTVQQRAQKKQRMIQAMKQRASNFRFILTGVPQDFLPRELNLLVLSSLIDVLETLTKLEPGVAAHQKELLSLTEQRNQAQRQSSSAARPNIDNPQQIKEVKACLTELNKFVFHLEGKGRFNRQQADTYRAMIKQLVLQLSVDGYVLHGRQAREKDKLQLATHYFQLALNLMIKERSGGIFESRIAQLKTIVEELTAQMRETEQTADDASPEASEADIKEQWDEFDSEQSHWKKKQIYD